MNTWSKVEELMEFVKTHDIKELKDYWTHKEEEKKRNNTILWIFAAIGVVAAVAGIAYAVYRYLMPDCLEDYDDDFDDFEDDFFEDEEDDAEEPQKDNKASEEE